MFNNKDGVSQRKLPGRFQCTQSYVNRVIKSVGIQKYKKRKIPNRSNQQKEVNRAKCATHYRKYRDREWIMDDESYFTKTRRKNKYDEKKLLVWISMSPRGITEPFIMASGNAVDQFVYRDSCLAPRLLPFIKTNHSDGNYIF